MSEQAKNLDQEPFFSKLGISLTSLKGAQQAIEVNRFTGNVICLVGPAGIGKTHITRQVAAARKPLTPFRWEGKEWTDSVPLVALYLAHMQAEDMGVPYPCRARRNERLKECEFLFNLSAQKIDNGCAHKAYVHATALAKALLDDNELDAGVFEFLIEKRLSQLPPEGILFLDEWNRADKQVIKAFFTLLEDRAIHGHTVVPAGVQIVAAMNPSDGAYSVNEAEKDHAFRRRLSFVAVTVNEGAWLDYAEGKFHPYVVEYLKAMPTHLYDAKLRDAGKAFPCPATWEKVSVLLQQAEQNKVPLNNLGIELSICGSIGHAVGSQFMAYIQDQETVINPTDVLTKYTEKSTVRKRVKTLVAKSRHDILEELSSGVALMLLHHKPDVPAVAPYLALFLGDLHAELATNFIVYKLTTASEGVDGVEDYLNKLSIALSKQPAYQQVFVEISATYQKGQHACGNGSAPDPLEETT